MKKYLLCLILFLTALFKALSLQIGLSEDQVNSLTSGWGPPTQNVQISIGLDGNSKKFKTNQVITLMVRIKNLSTNEEFTLPLQSAILLTEGLSLSVVSSSGKDISPAFSKSHRFSGGVLRIQPGKADGFSFNLNEVCRMNEVGNYETILKISRSASDKKKPVDIVSNPLQIAIVY